MIKEAIEIVCVGREKLLTVGECHKVVNCLRQGDKYRQEDLKTIQFYIKYYNIWKILKANTDKETINYMDKLEQKYSPKEEKNEIKSGI